MKQYIELTVNDYEFTIISDDFGVRLGSMTSLKKNDYTELQKYRSALAQLQNELERLAKERGIDLTKEGV